MAIIGGIIGYQSGELLAGAAIGAGFQYGGDIVNGIGEMISNPVKDVAKAEIDSVAGRIDLPRSAFTINQLGCLTREMQDIFDENKWTWTLQQKKTRSGRIEFMEKWLCKRPDGVEFEMTVLREKSKKPSISITGVSNEGNKRSEITVQIFNWLSSAVKRKC